MIQISHRKQEQAPEVDLSPVHEHLNNHDQMLNQVAQYVGKIMTELEMQRRALVALKQQRDVDRSRRLMLIQRMKKEQKLHQKTKLQMKVAIGAALLISIVSLIRGL